MNKLVGKKIGEAPDATVCFKIPVEMGRELMRRQTFAKADLPKETRVIQPGQMVTKDFNPDRWVFHALHWEVDADIYRLNVHVDDQGTVTHVDLQ